MVWPNYNLSSMVQAVVIDCAVFFISIITNYRGFSLLLRMRGKNKCIRETLCQVPHHQKLKKRDKIAYNRIILNKSCIK